MPSMSVYYKPQPDPETFEARYRDEHIPIVATYENLSSYRFSKVSRSIVGAFPYAYVFVATWDTPEGMKADLNAEPAKRATEHAQEIAPNGFDVVMTEDLA